MSVYRVFLAFKYSSLVVEYYTARKSLEVSDWTSLTSDKLSCFSLATDFINLFQNLLCLKFSATRIFRETNSLCISIWLLWQSLLQCYNTSEVALFQKMATQQPKPN